MGRLYTNCMNQTESAKYIVRSPCGRSLKLHLPVNLQLAVYLHSFASILRHLQLHEFVKYAG